MREVAKGRAPGRITTGVTDDVMCGGLPPDRRYLAEGEPGSGKATLALQFFLGGVAHGEWGQELHDWDGQNAARR